MTVDLKSRSITLPFPPSANRYWRMFRNRMTVSAEARAYQLEVFFQVVEGHDGIPQPIDGPVAVTLRVYRPRRSGDLDNRLKVVLDAMQGLLYHDDSQIVELHAHRFDDPDCPRVEVDVIQYSSNSSLVSHDTLTTT